MREIKLPFYGSHELDGMDATTLEVLLTRARSVRARIDGYEAQLLTAIYRANLRAANSRNGHPDSDKGSPEDSADDENEADNDGSSSEEEAEEEAEPTPELSQKAKREAEERSRRLEQHPEIAQALADGRINTEQADRITKAELPADVKLRLLEEAYGQTADETRAAVALAVKQADEDSATKRLERQRKARRGSCGKGDDDMIWINARFDPVTGAAIKEEYDRRERAAYHHDVRTISNPRHRRTHQQRGADVIASMILDGIIPAATDPVGNPTPASRNTPGQLSLVDATSSDTPDDPFDRARPTLNLILTPDAANNVDDPDAVAYTLDGAPVPAKLATDLICSAQINAWVLSADRELLDLGFDVELATPEQKLALAIRDQTCRWRGCDREASRCEAHHMHHREHAGRSDLDNYALLCPYHHDRLHQAKLWLRMGTTADKWILKDVYGTVVDQWTKPTPPWAQNRDPEHDRGDPNTDAA
ncbi:MAG: hypothetical protein GY708_01460 [Actinomycetia bacterium]|nr:hypothetical protein [Actinomycetes bacterium]